MVRLGRGDTVDGLQGLLHCHFAVVAHHALDVNGLYHIFFGLGAALVIVAAVIELAQVQPQGVGHHAEAGQAHGRRAEHGIQCQAKGHKAACGQRNADDIVDKRPEQILVDISQSSPAEPNCRRHIQKAALHEHHIRRVNGHVRAGADGNARIRPGQGRGIVDSVAYHGDLALGLQLPDHGLLAVRQHPGDDLVHSGLGPDGLGRTLVVSGEHDHLDAHVLQLPNGLGAVRLHGVRHGDHSGENAVTGKEQRGLALLCQGMSLGRHIRRYADGTGNKLQAAAQQRFPLQLGAQAVSGQGLEIRYRIGFHTSRGPLLQDGLGKRMLAFAFQGQGKLQQFILLRIADNIRHLGFSLGDGAGFVQNNDLRLSGLLQRDGRLKQNTVLGTHAVANHDGHRGSQAQGTGTADDQHGNATGQGKGKIPAQKQPDNGGRHRNGNNRRNKHTGDLFSNFRNGGLGCRRIGNHFDDLGKGGVLPYPTGPAAQEAGLIDGSSGDPVAHRLVHRDAFAGEGGFIDGAAALQDNTVHGDALPGADNKDIILLHLFNGHRDLLPIPDQGRSLGSQIHQALQSIRGLALGAGLQHFANGDQGQDHGGGLEIEFVHIGHDPCHIPVHLGIGHGEEGIHAPHEGGHGA